MSLELSEADLALRVTNGHREAEAALCRRMAPRIRLYGLRHLRSSSAAEDVVQQVLVAVLEALRGGRLREPGQGGTFLAETGSIVYSESIGFAKTRRATA